MFGSHFFINPKIILIILNLLMVNIGIVSQATNNIKSSVRIRMHFIDGHGARQQVGRNNTTLLSQVEFDFSS